MLKEFGSVSKLIDEIHNDKNHFTCSAKRFPIRYIFFNNRRDYLEFQNKIQYVVKNIFYLRTFTSEDKWVTGPTIFNFFNNIPEDLIVYDFSEIIRFFDDKTFNTVLTQISSKETSENLRIYVPLFGLKDRFLSVFWNTFYRKEEWAPLWAVSGETEKINIYQLDFPLDLNKLEDIGYFLVRSTQEWFKSIEQPNPNIISSSMTLSALIKNVSPDRYFDFTIVPNIKEFLKIILNKDIQITYTSDEDDYWRNILDICLSNKNVANLNHLLSSVFNIKNIQNCDIYFLLKLFIEDKNEFHKWLLKEHILQENRFDQAFKYLKAVLRGIGKPTKLNLLRSLWLAAFKSNVDTIMWIERKNILRYIHGELKEEHGFIENDLRNILLNIHDQKYEEIKIKLTMITDAEKQFFIKKILQTTDYKKILSETKEMYEDLYYYLSWDELQINEIPNWVIEYFRLYNLSKLKDEKLAGIDDILDEKNANKESFCRWYYTFDRPNFGFGKFIWIDGLGIEWLPFLIHYLNYFGQEHNIIIEQKAIVRAKLPTITEINKWDQHEKISDLDEYCHKVSSFNLPDVLIDEIEVVKNIAKKIIERVDDELFISADHGFTFLVNKKYHVEKIYNFENVHHEGRCILDFKNDLNEDKYFTWNLEDQHGMKALVASKHYSLGNLPRREVHGGATPEEVLVPFLKLKRIREKIKFTISPQTLEIDIRKPIFRITIHPEPISDVFLILQGKQFLLKREDGFSVELRNLNVGTYDCIITIGSEKIDYQFSVKGGFKEVDLI